MKYRYYLIQFSFLWRVNDIQVLSRLKFCLYLPAASLTWKYFSLPQRSPIILWIIQLLVATPFHKKNRGNQKMSRIYVRDIAPLGENGENVLGSQCVLSSINTNIDIVCVWRTLELFLSACSDSQSLKSVLYLDTRHECCDYESSESGGLASKFPIWTK